MRARGQGFFSGRALFLDKSLIRFRSSIAHCLHRMAVFGALGDCESHLGLNSTRTQLFGSASELTCEIDVEGQFQVLGLTLRPHILYEESPISLADKCPFEFVLASMIYVPENVVELVDNACFMKHYQFLVYYMVTKNRVDGGLKKLVLQKIVVCGRSAE